MPSSPYINQLQQKRRSDIENSPTGLSYRLFKENFEFEHYLVISPDKDRITYCRFRTGNHRLPSNWSNISCLKLTLSHFGFTFP
jgi:hypothetical protein